MRCIAHEGGIYLAVAYLLRVRVQTSERVERIPGLRCEPYFALISPDHGFIAPTPFSTKKEPAAKSDPASPRGSSKDLSSPAISATKQAPPKVRTWTTKPQAEESDTSAAGTLSAPGVWPAHRRCCGFEAELHAMLHRVGHARAATPTHRNSTSAPAGIARAQGGAPATRTGAFSSVEFHHLEALPASALTRLHAEMLAEARMRVLASLKRYFHRKRHEGLLSGNGLRMLDNACDTCIDRSFEPIDVFSKLSSVRAVPRFVFLENTPFSVR